jgi:hypothetical protein
MTAHTDTSPTAVVRCVQACEVPCKVTLRQGSSGDGQGISRVAVPVQPADWRSLRSMAEGGVHWGGLIVLLPAGNLH